MKPLLATAFVLTLASLPGAQTPETHAPTGEFRQPTPADRYRQVATLDNLVHPAGYVCAEEGTFGDVVELGEGERTVILLAGLGPGWHVFDSLIEAKRTELRFLGVTLAGYGGSSAPPMPAPGTSFAEGSWLANGRVALARLLAERELEKPIVVAFYSDAARIALRYALEHPDALGGVLVISASPRFPLPPGTAHGPAMDGFANNWFKTVTGIMWPSGMWPANAYANDPALSEKTWWDVLLPTVPTAIRYTVECWADNLVPDLVHLRTRTIVLSPGLDEELSALQLGATITQRFQGGWDEAADAGASIEHRIVPDARLLIWEDQPAGVLDALDGLLAD